MTNSPFSHDAATPADVRYDEASVIEIFRLATLGETAEERTLSPPSRTGLTLSELHRIGDEVGIAPERLTLAARQVDADRMVSQSVATHSFELTASLRLAEAPCAETWGRIVAVLRDAFEETGVVTDEGPLRRWRGKEYDAQDVSRIEARLEPDPYAPSWRLLLTSKAVDHTMSVGAFFAVVGAVIAAVPLGLGLPGKFALLGAFVVGCGGLIFFAGTRWRGEWRQRRAQQFRSAIAGLVRLGLRSEVPVSRQPQVPPPA